MTVIKGNLLPSFTLKLGTGTAVEFGTELRSIKQGEGEGEVTTFAQRAAGLRPVAITVEADLDMGTGKLYNFLVANAGAANVAWSYKISSGAVSASNPLYSGTCTLPAVPLFDAEQSAEALSYEVVFETDSFSVAFTGA